MTLLHVFLIACVLAVPSLAFADTAKKDTTTTAPKKTRETKGSSADKSAPKKDEKTPDKKFVTSLNQ